LGLLIEESRTNYATQSANPSAWTPTNGATKETFAAVTAPDGSTITQGFRIPDSGSRVYPTLSSPGTVEPVGSVYARAVSGTATLKLFIQGVAVQTDVTVPSDSWVRLNGTKASGSTTAFSVRGNAIQSEDVYLWGAQLEEGSFPTSYIPTSGSTVTRSPDIATIEGTNFSSWFNQSEGTVFTDLAAKGVSSIDAAFAIGSSGDADRWLQQYFLPSSVFYEYEQGAPPAHPYTVGSFIKSAIGRSQGDNAVALNGSIVQSDTYSGSYNPVFLKIGVSGDPNRIFNGHIARLAYYPYRLTDTTLQEITS
jgi:hypothetical protein